MSKVKVLSLALAALLALGLLAGCGGAAAGAQPAGTPETGSTPAGEKRLSIVTTIFPYYDFVRAAVGELADVTMLIKPGAESHSYDPAPADIVAVEDADLFVYTGGIDDAWAANLLAPMATEGGGPTVLRMLDHVQAVEEELVEGMQAEDEHDHDHDHSGEETHDHSEEEAHDDDHDHSGAEPQAVDASHLDDHIWTSPKNAVLMMRALAETLAELDAANAAAYTEASETYIAEIEAVDAELHSAVENGTRNLVVFADRFPFRYLMDELGLTYRAAFPGCSADSNPSAGTVAGLADVVKENELPYVYTIELSNGSIAGVIQEETGCDVLTLHSCQSVTAEEFEGGETYVSLMRQNAENLAKGLA